MDTCLMKKNYTLLVITLLSVALAGAACKKKNADQQAAKPTEGSAAVAGSAAGSAGSAAEPTPAAGSAAPAGAAEPAKQEAGSVKLLEAAKQAGNFTTFLKAVDAAGLTANLDGPGPFTVFAPTDEAFAKVPAKDLEALLADKTKLTKVLQYHVVSGTVTSKDLATAKVEKTIQGPELAVDATSGLKVGGATVVKSDIVATNGVIHAIDTVLAPPAK